MDVKAVDEASMRSIWHQCLPHIKFMTPRTDVCDCCEKLLWKVSSAVGEEEKLMACNNLTAHVHAAQKEREYYRQKTKEAAAGLKCVVPSHPPPYPCCSQNLSKATLKATQRLHLVFCSKCVTTSFSTPSRFPLLENSAKSTAVWSKFRGHTEAGELLA